MLGKPKLVLIFLSASIVLYGLVGGLLEDVAAEDDVYGQLEIFSSVLTKLENEYVEHPDLPRAINGALLGMLEMVDPFSSFVEQDIFSQLQVQAGENASPGMTLSKRSGYAYVVSIEAGSPAALAGIRSGDLVESVDGIITTEMSLWEVTARLKGRQGTNVSIRVVRPRRASPMEVTLRRGFSDPGSVKGTVIGKGIGLLDIPHLSGRVSESVVREIRLLGTAGVNGLLIDLRGTAGGLLDEAIAVADLFLVEGATIVSIAGRGGTKEEVVAKSDPVDDSLKLVVLVDGGTSGPAEVLATALVDHGKAAAIGLRTNGHGSLQERFDLADGSVVFLATRLLVRKDGRPLQGVRTRSSGLTPKLESPSPDFVSNFYLAHLGEEITGSELEDFYRELSKAIEEEQLKNGIEEVRRRILKKAA
jgi:carboxyl-terminal processing protease